jgi:hypothetical protein
MEHPSMKLRIQNKVCDAMHRARQDEPAKPNKKMILMKMLLVPEFNACGVQMCLG